MKTEVIKSLKVIKILTNTNNGKCSTSLQNGSWCLISLYMCVLYIPNWFLYAELGDSCTVASGCIGPFMTCGDGNICACEADYVDSNGNTQGGTCQGRK